MEDVKQLMRHHYLKYASYVILDRAIPHVIDGLKPVQRRILHTLWTMDDGKLHKVANVAGQTMVYHPHGDAPIIEALVNMANRGYLLDQQGNFGNIFTGDPPAAARYIETRLAALAKETLFNPDLTPYVPSYDGRHQEPVVLPAKIPLLLMQGASGIAVGMSTSVLPHNFGELLEAEIALLEGRTVSVFPDFPTGGIMDASDYNQGRGKVKLRAKIEVRDTKTLVITEICYGTTTESLIRSIDEAAKRGKIKIDAINDYTAEKVEIEIKLPRGQYAEELIQALYAYTECEVAIHSQIVVIKDELPWETDVVSILNLYTEKLQEYLRIELELERDRFKEKIFAKTLEQIFIENRLYQRIENADSYEKVHDIIAKDLAPFHAQLSRIPMRDDREGLLSIPIRRISKFDLEKNQAEIQAIAKLLAEVEKHLKNVKKFAINYLKKLLAKYAKNYPRRTEMSAIEEINMRAIEMRQVTIGFDPSTGFLGTKVTGKFSFECTNFDKVLVLFDDGTYTVINLPEKHYLHTDKKKVVYVGCADKKTVINVLVRDPKTYLCFAKRFIISQFILDKVYRYFEEGLELQFISTKPNVTLELQFIPAAKQKLSKMDFDFDKTLIKGVSSKGIRVASRGVKKVLVGKNEGTA